MKILAYILQSNLTISHLQCLHKSSIQAASFFHTEKESIAIALHVGLYCAVTEWTWKFWATIFWLVRAPPTLLDWKRWLCSKSESKVFGNGNGHVNVGKSTVKRFCWKGFFVSGRHGGVAWRGGQPYGPTATPHFHQRWVLPGRKAKQSHISGRSFPRVADV